MSDQEQQEENQEDNPQPTEAQESEPVLSDEEKGALLDGMESGEIEFQSSDGRRYGELKEFEVAASARIVSNSYPRLIQVNDQFASRFVKHAERLLNSELMLKAEDLRSCKYADYCEQFKGLNLLVEFSVSPLEGSAFLHMSAAMLGMLVETFYGGDSSLSDHEADEFFTSGELSVASLFSAALLESISRVWKPLAEFQAEQIDVHDGMSSAESISAGDALIVSEFKMAISGRQDSFSLLWPLSTVAPLLPVFEGQKRERDLAKDAHWAKALRQRVTGSTVEISSSVGNTSMTLREITELNAGDVIEISNPRRGTVFARSVPILEGNFGVYDGRYAIETNHWLSPEAGAETGTSSGAA